MLNIHLFDRVGREIILTPQGERLYYWAQQILLLKDQAMLDLNQEMTAFRGKIRVAVSSVPGQFILPKLVKKFREEYSQVTFHIKQSSSKLVAEKVINGFVDFGILGERYENDRLHYIPLLKEKLVLITSAQANFNSPIQLQDIIHYPIIMRNAGSGTNAMLERFLKKQQIAKDKLNIIAYTDDSQSLIQYVIQNIGISIISEIAAKGYADNQLLNMYEIPEFNDERYFYLVYNKQKTLPLISKTFIEQAPQWLD